MHIVPLSEYVKTQKLGKIKDPVHPEDRALSPLDIETTLSKLDPDALDRIYLDDRNENRRLAIDRTYHDLANEIYDARQSVPTTKRLLGGPVYRGGTFREFRSFSNASAIVRSHRKSMDSTGEMWAGIPSDYDGKKVGYFALRYNAHIEPEESDVALDQTDIIGAALIDMWFRSEVGEDAHRGLVREAVDIASELTTEPLAAVLPLDNGTGQMKCRVTHIIEALRAEDRGVDVTRVERVSVPDSTGSYRYSYIRGPFSPSVFVAVQK